MINLIFLIIFYININAVKYIEDLELSPEEFERYPLISREEQDSECKGVKQIEERRDVDGEEVSKFILMDISNLHFVALDSRSQGTVEVWHR